MVPSKFEIIRAQNGCLVIYPNGEQIVYTFNSKNIKGLPEMLKDITEFATETPQEDYNEKGLKALDGFKGK